MQVFFTRKMSDSETIELACLGRPFQLGMLYDCRKDLLIPGNKKHKDTLFWPNWSHGIYIPGCRGGSRGGARGAPAPVEL